MIAFCTCKHEFQDKRYGEQKRVHNQCGSGKGQNKGKVCCTVCGVKK